MPTRGVTAGVGLFVLALIAAGCDDSSSDGPTGQIRVEQRGVPVGYIEGAVSFVELRDPDGEVVEKESRQPGNRDPVLMGHHGRSVPIGRYELYAYSRPCEGNCGGLDPPVRPCSTFLRVQKGELTTARVDLNAHGPCEVSVERQE